MWEKLVKSKLLPDKDGLRWQIGDDIAAAVIRAWSTTSQRRPNWMAEFADRYQKGFRLHQTDVRSSAWIGNRLIWSRPCRDEPRQTVGVVSSHLGRPLEDHRDWFDALRTVCANAARQNSTLLAVPGSTASPFVVRAAAMFGANCLEVRLPAKRETLARWFQRLGQTRWPASCLALSPVVDQECPAALQDAPLADRVIYGLSEQIIAIKVRRKSTTEMLLRHRLRDARCAAGSVKFSAADNLVDESLRRELLGNGAVAWFLFDEPGAGEESAASSSTCIAAPLISLPASDNWQLLSHCTRRRDGPWPHDQQDDYLDDLILGQPSANHSALAALSRIVSQRRLLASGESIRGGYPVVSFTATPLAKIPSRRVFRPHRGRWDFEPYGLCIDRRWLIDRGAKQVVYGQEDVWQSLPDAKRPFFQLQQTKRGTIDWTTEQEWRVQNSLDLGELPAEAGIVFVPTEQEAAHVATISRWPVTVLRMQSSAASG